MFHSSTWVLRIAAVCYFSSCEGQGVVFAGPSLLQRSSKAWVNLATAQDASGHVVLVQCLLQPETLSGHKAAFQHPSTPANHGVLSACFILNMYHSINTIHRQKASWNAEKNHARPGRADSAGHLQPERLYTVMFPCTQAAPYCSLLSLCLWADWAGAYTSSIADFSACQPDLVHPKHQSYH